MKTLDWLMSAFYLIIHRRLYIVYKNMLTEIISSFKLSLFDEAVSEELFLITRRSARYTSRKCRLLWIIGLRIDASWKFPTRKSYSRIPVASGGVWYVYESIFPRALGISRNYTL
jgi:hypothetical protein